jgi:lipoprotein Spr
MNRDTLFRIHFFAIMILCLVVFDGCKSPNNQGKGENKKSENSTHFDESEENKKEEIFSQELLGLETEYADMLSPILSLKKEQPKTYWFIVSWLKTAYKTPNWTGYYSDEWMVITKENGIDCSGFSRVMLDQIFDRKVSGGSQGILDHYCKPIGLESIEMGDLVFFRAPHSRSDRIVHVGVYLMDNYFVHATSTKSAAKGLGLSVNSLKEENWAKEFVSGGKVKS